MVSVCLGRFMERSGVLPTTQFPYRKGLGTCGCTSVRVPCTAESLESGQEARIVQIDFSAAVDRVKHLGILYKLFSVGIGGSVLSIFFHSFYETDHSKLWLMVVEVNWLTLYQECRRAVFLARFCSTCTRRAFSHFGK